MIHDAISVSHNTTSPTWYKVFYISISLSHDAISFIKYIITLIWYNISHLLKHAFYPFILLKQKINLFRCLRKKYFSKLLFYCCHYITLIIKYLYKNSLENFAMWVSKSVHSLETWPNLSTAMVSFKQTLTTKNRRCYFYLRKGRKFCEYYIYNHCGLIYSYLLYPALEWPHNFLHFR